MILMMYGYQMIQVILGTTMVLIGMVESPTGEDRRTTATTTMRCISFRMVTSTTSASTFPTGSKAIGPPNPYK